MVARSHGASAIDRSTPVVGPGKHGFAGKLLGLLRLSGDFKKCYPAADAWYSCEYVLEMIQAAAGNKSHKQHNAAKNLQKAISTATTSAAETLKNWVSEANEGKYGDARRIFLRAIQYDHEQWASTFEIMYVRTGGMRKNNPENAPLPDTTSRCAAAGRSAPPG